MNAKPTEIVEAWAPQWLGGSWCPYRKSRRLNSKPSKTPKMNAKQPEKVGELEPKGREASCFAVSVSENQCERRSLPTKSPIGLNLKVDFERKEDRRRKSGSPAEFVDQTIHVGDGHEFSASGFFGDVTRIRLKKCSHEMVYVR